MQLNHKTSHSATVCFCSLACVRKGSPGSSNDLKSAMCLAGKSPHLYLQPTHPVVLYKLIHSFNMASIGMDRSWIIKYSRSWNSSYSALTSYCFIFDTFQLEIRKRCISHHFVINTLSFLNCYMLSHRFSFRTHSSKALIQHIVHLLKHRMSELWTLGLKELYCM